MSRSLPDTDDPLFRAFWLGTEANRLLVQQCSTCAAHRWPPREICRQCHSDQCTWVRVKESGYLFTWTVVEPRDESADSYVVGIVELEFPAGVRMVGNIIGIPSEELVVGMRLAPVFERVEGRATLVDWSVRHPEHDDKE